MTHLYVPHLSLEPFQIGTNWSLTKTYLSNNDSKTQLCLLNCFTEEEAASLVKKIENIIRDAPNRNNFYLNAMGSNVVASRNLLVEIFDAELYLDKEAEKEKVSLINLETNSVFHMNLDLKARSELNPPAPQAHQRKHQELAPQMTQTIYFPSLIEGDDRHVLWVNAGHFKGHPMVSLFGYDKINHVISIENFIKTLTRKHKHLTDCTGLIGRKGTTLVVSEELLTALLGPATRANLALTDTNPNRHDYINAIYLRWVKDAAWTVPINLSEHKPEPVVLNLPESATLDDYVNSGGTLSPGDAASSFATSRSGFFFNETMTSNDTAVTHDNTDVQADSNAERWIRTILS